MGTVNYWKPSSAKKTFSKMDDYLWHKVYGIIKRLHPNKSIKWINKTYFPVYKDRTQMCKWIPTGPKEGNHLIKMRWTHIKRHAMIKFNYSPYDKSKREYFINRKFSC